VFFFIGLVFVAAIVVAIWLVRHPLVLLTVNIVPVAWWVFGVGGVALAGLVLLSGGLLVRDRSSVPVG
jgi:hypothetical protein